MSDGPSLGRRSASPIPRLILLLAAGCATLAGLRDHDPGEAGRAATCFGNHPCRACRDCSRCRYCHVEGGYCGVCSEPVPE